MALIFSITDPMNAIGLARSQRKSLLLASGALSAKVPHYARDEGLFVIPSVARDLSLPVRPAISSSS
jgi:hypothetical protein